MLLQVHLARGKHGEDVPRRVVEALASVSAPALVANALVLTSKQAAAILLPVPVSVRSHCVWPSKTTANLVGESGIARK